MAVMKVAGLAGAPILVALTFVHGSPGDSALLALRSMVFIGCMTAEFAYAGDLASPGRAVSTVTTLGTIGNVTYAAGPTGVVLWRHGFGREHYAWSAVGA
jgi:hypothetical protein